MVKNPLNSDITYFLIVFLLFISAQAKSALSENNSPPVKDRSASQVEQEKVQQKNLQNIARQHRASTQAGDREKLVFPQESACYQIKQVSWTQDNAALKLKSLHHLTQQAEGRCLGIQGIRLLANKLQNEIIRLGYITTRLDMPEQDLKKQVLYFSVVAGRVGKIKLDTDGADYINLHTTLPFGEGDLLDIRKLEQGSFNLQRTPGTKVKINLVPGTKRGESDLLIKRSQNKFWQVAAWANDAGDSSSGRYQGGMALYLNNLTSLSDTLFFSIGHDLNPQHKPEGNHNRAAGYSVPLGFWWLDFYASNSHYRQHVQGNYSDWMLKNSNNYYSAQINRLLTHTVKQKTSAGLLLFNRNTRYYYNDYQLLSMYKKSAGWKLLIEHQRYFDRAIIISNLSYQRKMPWFRSNSTVEQENNLIDRTGRIVALDIQARVNFELYGQPLSYSPRLNLQLSPDTLSSLDRMAIGNRWSVRGFDGEYTLQDNQGWFLSNDFSWRIADKNFQPYLGVDVGQTIGHYSQQYYRGRTLAGSVAGIRGEIYRTGYDFFAGVPLHRPEGFHTDPLTLGFSLRWKY